MAVLPDASTPSLRAFLADHVTAGSTVITDGWQPYRTATTPGYTHERLIAPGSQASSLLPGAHRVASLAKRWLLGTHQGSVNHTHLDSYLNEFVFRFNRRRSRSRGLLFYRVLELAVAHAPVPTTSSTPLVPAASRPGRQLAAAAAGPPASTAHAPPTLARASSTQLRLAEYPLAADTRAGADGDPPTRPLRRPHPRVLHRRSLTEPTFGTLQGASWSFVSRWSSIGPCTKASRRRVRPRVARHLTDDRAHGTTITTRSPAFIAHPRVLARHRPRRRSCVLPCRRSTGCAAATAYRWFDLRDAQTGGAGLELGYGILRSDYSEKPGFRVLADLIRRLGR